MKTSLTGPFPLPQRGLVHRRCALLDDSAADGRVCESGKRRSAVAVPTSPTSPQFTLFLLEVLVFFTVGAALYPVLVKCVGRGGGSGGGGEWTPPRRHVYTGPRRRLCPSLAPRPAPPHLTYPPPRHVGVDKALKMIIVAFATLDLVFPIFCNSPGE